MTDCSKFDGSFSGQCLYDLLDNLSTYIGTERIANKCGIQAEEITQQLEEDGQNSDPLNTINVQKTCQSAVISASEGRDKESQRKLPREIQ